MGLRPGYGIRLDSARRLLGQHRPAVVVDAEWPAGAVRVSAYLGAVDLPAEIPGRVRCLVTDGEVVLVTWDANGKPDCFPGGGAEPGESVAETAQREVWEETGWHIDAASIEMLGWIHVESCFEPSSDLPFPHPDGFMTVVRAAPLFAEENQDTWTDVAGWVSRSALVPLRELPLLIEGAVSCTFLDRALGRRWRVLQ
ncbi:MAG: NUDIX hydrolase [Actinomycetota bacterium]|nr:NUDIX hydrolase [Actinomycetota bacterium]